MMITDTTEHADSGRSVVDLLSPPTDEDFDRAYSQIIGAFGHRQTAYEQANLFFTYAVTSADGYAANGSHEIRDALHNEGVPLGPSERFLLALNNQVINDLDLAYVVMKQKWDTTDEVEAEMAEIGNLIQSSGGLWVPRNSELSKRKQMIEPGLVDAQGITTLSRKRLVAVLPEVPVLIPDADGDQARWALSGGEIDKISVFMLDLHELAKIFPDSADEISELLKQGGPRVISNRRPVKSFDKFEALISAQDKVLRPAVTIYTFDRQHKFVKESDPRLQELLSAQTTRSIGSQALTSANSQTV